MKRLRRMPIGLLSAAAALLFFSGCAPKEAMVRNDAYVARGDFAGSAAFCEDEIDRFDRTQRNNLLWYLNAGLAYRFAHDNNASITAFDESEWLIKQFQEQLLDADVSQRASGLLVNETTTPYRGTQYDGVMANTYKAVDYLAMGDREGARVEFNRAIDRQRRAKAYYAEVIEKNREAIEKRQRSDERGVDVDSAMPQAQKVLAEKYPSLYSFEAYPDFINPMVSYLAGVFAMSEGDNQKAFTLLKEAYGMNPGNGYIAEDLAYVDALLDGAAPEQEPLVWVIIEDGQAPVKNEWRLDFPVFIFSNSLNYVSLALPRIHTRSSAFEGYSVSAEGSVKRGELLSDMDRVILSEFREAYPAILRRALFSAMTKAVIQYQTQRQMNNSEGNAQLAWALATIATTAYTIGSAQADTRIWSTLPKRFDLIRLKRPRSGRFTIGTSTGLVLKEIALHSSVPTLVYVKMTTSGARPSVSIIPLREN